jgi:hypothetical protein
MYLKRLYKHNKFLFLIIILFAVAQIVDNMKRGIAVSPFFSYGMYSAKIDPVKYYTVPEIFVNGKQLQAKDFSSSRWDNITYPVTVFYKLDSLNLYQWRTDIYRLLPFTDSSKFVNHLSEAAFKEWYNRRLQSLLNEQIDSINIVFTNYYFDGKSFHKQNNF